MEALKSQRDPAEMTAVEFKRIRRDILHCVNGKNIPTGIKGTVGSFYSWFFPVLRDGAVLTRFRLRFRIFFLRAVPVPVPAPVSYIVLKTF